MAIIRTALLATALLLAAAPLALAAPATLTTASRGADAVIHKLEFRDALMVDVIRALADMSGLNIVATEEAAKKRITVFLQNIAVRDALDTLSKNAGLWYRQDRNNQAYRIMTTEEYQKDVVVYREDTTRVFNLLHPNPAIVASAIRDLYGSRIVLSLGMQVDDFASNGNAGGLASQARSGQAALRRSTRSSSTGMLSGSALGAGYARGTTSVAENVVAEKLTADQLDKLSQMVDTGNATVSSDALQGISRSEQPIYVTVNREHNLILVRTSDAAAVREIERLIKEMDRPTPQVLLEMKILELTVGDSFSQLFNLAVISGDGKQGLGLGNSSIPSDVGSLIYSYIDSRIAARLELLQENNQVNTLSSPLLLASNNRPARVFVGEERVLVTGVTATDPVLNASGGVVTPAKITYETEIRDIGNTLNIVPKINADRTVTLSIQQDVSTVLPGAVSLPPITVGNSTQSFNIDSVKTANIEGIVVAKDGLTVAIGGLISSSVTDNERKVPLFGDLPVVGELFKRKEKANRKSELILLITPRIITHPSEAEDVSRDTVEPLSLQELG